MRWPAPHDPAAPDGPLRGRVPDHRRRPADARLSARPPQPRCRRELPGGRSSSRSSDWRRRRRDAFGQRIRFAPGSPEASIAAAVRAQLRDRRAAPTLVEYLLALGVMTMFRSRRVAARRTGAAPAARDHRHGAARVRREPRRADRAPRARRRAEGARRHFRRDARAARRRVRQPAPLRRQRLARAAHAARDHAHRGRRGARRPGREPSPSCARWGRPCARRSTVASG